MTNFCTQCGAKLIPEARFCSDCGRELAARKTSQPWNLTPFGGLLIALLMALIIWVFFQIGRSHVSTDQPLTQSAPR